MAQAYPKHDEDFYAWTQANANLLKQRKFEEIDVDHLIEELEEMGNSNENQLISRLGVLIAQLLKWQLQPDFRCRSWSGTIREQRIRIKRLLRKNPSLKILMASSVKESFEDALAILEKETPIDLNLLPATCPYTLEELQDDEYYPA
jgi:hypothetical protein